MPYLCGFEGIFLGGSGQQLPQLLPQPNPKRDNPKTLYLCGFAIYFKNELGQPILKNPQN
jgi:hypothetical protein